MIKTAFRQFKARGLTEKKAMQNAAFGKNGDKNQWAQNYLDGKISFCIAADNSLQTNRIT